MLNQVLIFGGVAMAIVITMTLVAFFMMTRGNPPRATISHVARMIGRRKARPLPPPYDAPYELDVLRIRVPDIELNGAIGGKDAMSILFHTQYFDMIKKMGASSSGSRP